MTDRGLSALASAGCGAQLTYLNLSSGFFLVVLVLKRGVWRWCGIVSACFSCSVVRAWVLRIQIWRRE